VNGNIGALRRSHGQQATYPRWRDLVQGTIPVPLIKATRACISFLLRDVWWQVEVDMVDALYFESWREIEMVLRNFATTQNMHLRLSIDGRSIGQAIYGHTILGEKYRVGTVSETSCLFVGVKAS
jgi:hypothetical protein